MRFYYPRSFLELLAVGFTLVALPLVFALANNAISIDQLANRSQIAVYRAVQTTQSSRRLVELLTSMERSARQFVILGDRSLLETYALTRKRFLATADGFASLPFDTEQKAALDAIVREEERIYSTLSDPNAKTETLAGTVESFVALGEYADTITRRSNELIDREVEAMRETAAQAQRIMLWQLLALIPVVIFLVVGFTIHIARPIRQLDAAIRRLGRGDFAGAVQVSGPDDLQQLGERLEWLRSRLLELEEQKNRFLRRMSHELKTPLTAIREGAELLAEEATGKLTPEQREITEILRHNSIELQKLIEDLLTYGASQFRKTALELRPVRVQEAINRVAGDQRLALRAKSLNLAIEAEDLVLAADFEKLRVILDNLVSNAIKFSPAGGTITVTARARGACLELEVADEGPGVAPQERERIFDPFYQGAAVARGRVKGTGIGLSIVREYVAAHGGTVEVVDDGNRSGACFRVRLPLYAGERE